MECSKACEMHNEVMTQMENSAKAVTTPATARMTRKKIEKIYSPPPNQRALIARMHFKSPIPPNRCINSTPLAGKKKLRSNSPGNETFDMMCACTDTLRHKFFRHVPMSRIITVVNMQKKREATV